MKKIYTQFFKSIDVYKAWDKSDYETIHRIWTGEDKHSKLIGARRILKALLEYRIPNILYQSYHAQLMSFLDDRRKYVYNHDMIYKYIKDYKYEGAYIYFPMFLMYAFCLVGVGGDIVVFNDIGMPDTARILRNTWQKADIFSPCRAEARMTDRGIKKYLYMGYHNVRKPVIMGLLTCMKYCDIRILRKVFKKVYQDPILFTYNLVQNIKDRKSVPIEHAVLAGFVVYMLCIYQRPRRIQPIDYRFSTLMYKFSDYKHSPELARMFSDIYMNEDFQKYYNSMFIRCTLSNVHDELWRKYIIEHYMTHYDVVYTTYRLEY